MIEQRKHKRFELNLPLEVIQTGSAATTVLGETRNMSSTGVLFTSPREMPVGESIEYFVSLPDTPGSDATVRLRCMGKVLRADEDSAYAATLERYEFIREPLTAVLERSAAAQQAQAWA